MTEKIKPPKNWVDAVESICLTIIILAFLLVFLRTCQPPTGPFRFPFEDVPNLPSEEINTKLFYGLEKYSWDDSGLGVL